MLRISLTAPLPGYETQGRINPSSDIFFFLFKLLAEVTYRNEHPKLLC